MIFRFSNYILDIDVDRTHVFYDRPDVLITSEKCTCAGCQNYDKAILQAPAAVLDFFRSLGIDPRKPAEVFDVMGGLDENGEVYYNGFYHVCGVRLQGEDAWVGTANGGKHLDMNRMYVIDSSFKVSFEKSVLMLHEEFPSPVLQIEIDAHLPWVLSEKTGD
ncbi:MAG: hypothetical protein IJW00_05965 [Clostridia bacterium]|nr:hypothetical protein [Clostridia bacterium]